MEIDAAGLFGQLDANGDGRIVAAEVGTDQAPLFARLVRTGDDNGDGQLDADEFTVALTPVRADKEMVQKQGGRLPGGDALIVLLAQMDADGNGQLDGEEIPARLKQIYEQLLRQGDEDKNGRLEGREISKVGPRFGMIALNAARRLGIDVEAELEKMDPVRRKAVERMGALPRPGELLTDPKEARQLFARLDANGDDALAADEAPEALAQLIKRGDRDGDDKLSRREFEAMLRRAAGADNQMAVEEPMASERTAAPGRNGRQLMKRFDRNRDGRLSRNEAPPRLAKAFDRADRNGDGELDAAEVQRAAAATGGAPQGRRAGRPKAGSDATP